jgi:UDP-glucose 4-epimerase
MTRRESHNILVTGAAGFIGSSLVPVLLSMGHRVIATDRFSNVKKAKLNSLFNCENFELIRVDLLNADDLKKVVNKSDTIFHLAANVDVRKGHTNTNIDFLNNIMATRNVLECMRVSRHCKKVIFTSSSVVYGDNPTMPTRENYGPLKPISLYAASKLACESLISGYVGTFGLEAVIFRLANIVGPNIQHGVIFDFIRKLKLSNGEYLEILGDGKQKKSYLYIDDCISALLIGLNEFRSRLEIFNVGSDDQIDTNTIARMIIKELGLQPRIEYSSKSKDGRGWIGDVKTMLLSTNKLKQMGWRANYSSKDSVSQTVKNMTGLSV